MTLTDIVTQLRSCCYECEAGLLTNNTAFVALEEMARAEQMIEITRAKSTHTFRINPYNGREIDQRPNRPYARWRRWAAYDSPEAAMAALLALERDASGNTTSAPGPRQTG